MSFTRHGDVAPGLRVDVDDGVHTWWLCNTARRNAITPTALEWIARRATTLTGEIIVVRGQGLDTPSATSPLLPKQKAFCAGFDLTALAALHPSSTTGTAPSLPDASLIAATTAMHDANATFVAALDGYAIGAGVELACACDLRICVRGAYFAVPAAELGVVYHATGLVAMRETFGPAGARRLLMLGERLSAEDAWASGALVRLCEPEAFEATLTEVLDGLRRAAPLSLRGNRDLLRRIDRAPSLDPEALLEHEARRRAAYASEDHQEARAARREGRAPRFRGH